MLKYYRSVEKTWTIIFIYIRKHKFDYRSQPKNLFQVD